jgi:ribonuclease VapC
MAIGRHCAALPDIDPRSADEILGYDETGMWRRMVVDPRHLLPSCQENPTRGSSHALLPTRPFGCFRAVSRVDLSCVIEGRKGETGRADVELLLRDGGFDIVSVTPQPAEIAVDALRRIGRSRHRARLNIGDCFAYALATATGHTRLFKCDDLIHTDIRPALPAAT